MRPCLPSQDPDPRARAARLDGARERVRYVWDQPPGIAMAEKVPHGEGYPAGVVAENLALAVATKANRAAHALLPAPGGADGSLASALAPYRALFATVPAPPLAAVEPDGDRADPAFAWQRVAGANPLTIEGVDRLPDAFPVTAAHFAAALDEGGEGDTLDAARAEGRLFLASYAALDGIALGTGQGAPKYLAAPLALFVQRAGKGLHPVAIQCAQTPGPGAPVLTPRDGVAWQMARAAVQVADLNLQETFFHLGRAHFLVEAFALATARQIAPEHPFAILLAPHFEGTIAINDAARTQLCAPGGKLEVLLAPTREASLGLALRGVQSFRLEDALLPADLRLRRVDDPSRLADYPYRDDARLLWDALSTFVSGYVALVYADDAAVAGDAELLAWASEIRADDGGRVRGFPAHLETRAALASALSWLIFTTTAQHAALNYTQLDMMAYAPNMPAAGYAPPPAAGETDAAAAWARFLPSLALAADQIDFFYPQSLVRVNRIGHYPKGHFHDARVTPLVEHLAADLARAEQTIEARNRGRFLPYPWLLPSRVPASIHI
jgi:arachidonate 15-lipoxygenase